MLPEINLLPKREKEGRTSYYIFLISAIICLLLYGLFAYFYFKTSSDLKLAEQQYEQLEMEKTALETKLDQSSVEEDDVGESIRYVEHFIIPTSHFIEELLDLLPKHAYLSEYKFNFETAELQTQFETLNDVSLYTEELVKSNFIKEVAIEEIETISTEELNDEEDQGVYSFETIPRYDVSYSLVLDLQAIKKEVAEDV